MSKVCEHCGSALPEYGGITLDRDRAEIRYGGKRLGSLTSQEMALFTILLEKAGKIVSKDTLLDMLYQLRPSEDEIPEVKIVDVFICKLRKKVAPMGINVATAWGRGYYMAEPK